MRSIKSKYIIGSILAVVLIAVSSEIFITHAQKQHEQQIEAQRVLADHNAKIKNAKTLVSASNTDISQGNLNKALNDLQQAKTVYGDLKDSANQNKVTGLIAQVEYKIAQQDEKQGKIDDAVSKLEDAQNDGLNVSVELKKLKSQQTNIAFDKLVASAKSAWSKGDQQGAIDSLNNAIGLNADSQKTQNAKQLLQQYQAQIAQSQIQTERSQMKKWEGDGDAKIAVGNVELHNSTELHTAGDGMTFVYLYVGVLNVGTGSVQANPMNFTLSTPDGYTVSITDDMFNLNGYLDSTNLNPSQSAAGWIAFYTKKSSQYTLNYSDYLNTASKTVIP